MNVQKYQLKIPWATAVFLAVAAEMRRRQLIEKIPHSSCGGRDYDYESNVMREVMVIMVLPIVIMTMFMLL